MFFTVCFFLINGTPLGFETRRSFVTPKASTKPAFYLFIFFGFICTKSSLEINE